LSTRRRKWLLSEGDRGESAQRRKNERHAHKPISHFLVLLRMKLLCWWRSRVFQVLVNAFLGDRAAAAVVAQAVTIGSLQLDENENRSARLGRITGYGHFRSRFQFFQQFLARVAFSDQVARRAHFRTPGHDLAVFVFHVEIQLRTGAQPLEFRNDTLHLDGLLHVVRNLRTMLSAYGPRSDENP